MLKAGTYQKLCSPVVSNGQGRRRGILLLLAFDTIITLISRQGFAPPRPFSQMLLQGGVPRRASQAAARLFHF